MATTWMVNPKYPKSKDSTVPLYGVRWAYADGKTGSNAWPTKAAAEAAIGRVTAKGAAIVSRSISYVGGWAF